MRKGKKRSWFNILRRTFLGLCTLLLLLYIFLHSSYAQDRIAAWLSEKLSTDHRAVTLTGLSGFWPFHLNLQACRIEDEDGLWFEARNIKLDWKVRSQKLKIQNLHVETVTLYQQPRAAEKSSAPGKAFTEFPLALEVKQIQIDRLLLSEKFAGKETVMRLEGKAGISKTGRIDTQLTVNSGEFDAMLRANYGLSEKTFEGELSVESKVARDLSISFGRVENGMALKGYLRSPDLPETIRFVEPYLASFNLPPQDIMQYLENIPGKAIPAELDFNLRILHKVVEADAQMRIFSGNLSSQFSYRKDQEKWDFQLQAQLPEIHELGLWPGQEFSGQLDGTISMGGQHGIKNFSSDFSLGSLKYRTVEIGKIEGNIQKEKQSFLIELTGKTPSRKLFLQCRFSPSAEGWTVFTENIDMDIPPFSLHNSTPVVLNKTKEGFSLQPTALLLNGIPVEVSGRENAGQVNASLKIPKIHASELPRFKNLEIKGFLMGGLQLKGKWDQPDLQIHLACEALELIYENFETNIKLDGELNGRWSPAGLNLKSTFEDHRKNQFSFEMNSPESWSLSPFNLPRTDADLSMRLLGSIDLSLLNHFKWLPNQQVSGQLHTDVDFSQKNQRRELKGSVNLQQGKYENFQLGSLFSQVEITATLHDQEIELTRAEARTPGNGKLTATGTWNLQEKPGSGHIAFTMDNARILHLDPVQAAVSGKVSVSKKSNQKADVDGKLILEETTFHMDRLPKPVPKPVPFVIKGQAVPQTTIQKPRTPPKAGKRVYGEIDVEIPSRLTVQGNNLYSTWEGAFKLSLQNTRFLLNGKLMPRRGTVNFFGRAFRLSKGTVHFNDQLGTPPILDLEADYSREDLDAVLLITGRADNPKFNLQSSPPLPEDEILSRILFGKDMATITGLQALEVGMALKSMMDSDGDSGWDLVGKARDFLGVDQLELRESGDAEGTTEIVAGRQINNRLYLEINQSLKEQGSSILLEYEIRRNLSISTETGTHILPGIGINWKRDY